MSKNTPPNCCIERITALQPLIALHDPLSLRGRAKKATFRKRTPSLFMFLIEKSIPPQTRDFWRLFGVFFNGRLWHHSNVFGIFLLLLKTSKLVFDSPEEWPLGVCVFLAPLFRMFTFTLKRFRERAWTTSLLYLFSTKRDSKHMRPALTANEHRCGHTSTHIRPLSFVFLFLLLLCCQFLFQTTIKKNVPTTCCGPIGEAWNWWPRRNQEHSIHTHTHTSSASCAVVCWVVPSFALSRTHIDLCKTQHSPSQSEKKLHQNERAEEREPNAPERSCKVSHFLLYSTHSWWCVCVCFGFSF